MVWRFVVLWVVDGLPASGPACCPAPCKHSCLQVQRLALTPQRLGLGLETVGRMLQACPALFSFPAEERAEVGRCSHATVGCTIVAGLEGRDDLGACVEGPALQATALIRVALPCLVTSACSMAGAAGRADGRALRALGRAGSRAVHPLPRAG